METPYASDGYTPTPPLSETRKTNFQHPDQVLEAGKDYRAVLETGKGRIVIDLFQDQTPETVNNFIFLARYRFYDGVVFHRVLEDFMAQTGDPTGTGQGGPGYRFGLEVRPQLTFDSKGVVGMARTQDPNSNGSQFFITFKATPWLDGDYTVFGKVIEGEDVLDALQRIDPMRPSGVEPDIIKTLYIVEKA